MMKRMAGHHSPLEFLGFALCVLGVLGGGMVPSRAEDRSVKIIEGAPEPIQSLPPSPAPPATILKTKNPAGVTVEVLPGTDLPVGTKIAFRVATQKPGYLLLIDIDAAGKLTQIYPNVLSLTQASDKAASGNFIKPGHPMTIPDAGNPLARFEFIAEPPLGAGTVVAILSAQSVQLIDLPDLPGEITGQQAAVDYLYTVAQGLKIASVDKPGRFVDGVWSFDAKSYQIK
jgi:hypothetical protein